MLTTYYPRYAIAWRFENSSEWRLWMSETREDGVSYPIATFQWYSDCDHRLPNATDYMEKYVAKKGVECKIVELDVNVYDIEYEQNGGIVRKGQILY